MAEVITAVLIYHKNEISDEAEEQLSHLVDSVDKLLEDELLQRAAIGLYKNELLDLFLMVADAPQLQKAMAGKQDDNIPRLIKNIVLNLHSAQKNMLNEGVSMYERKEIIKFFNEITAILLQYKEENLNRPSPELFDEIKNKFYPVAHNNLTPSGYLFRGINYFFKHVSTPIEKAALNVVELTIEKNDRKPSNDDVFEEKSVGSIKTKSVAKK